MTVQIGSIVAWHHPSGWDAPALVMVTHDSWNAALGTAGGYAQPSVGEAFLLICAVDQATEGFGFEGGGVVSEGTGSGQWSEILTTPPSAPLAQTASSAAAANNATATVASSGGTLLLALVTRSGGLSTGALTGVTDSAGNTWQMVTRGAVSAVSDTRIEAWACSNAEAVTSITFASATSQSWAWNVTEWSDMTLSSPVDAASVDGSGTTSSTTISSPTITPPTATDLVVAACHYPQVSGALNSTGWTALYNFDDATAGSARAAYTWPGSTGSQYCSWLLTGAQAAGVVTVALRAK